jgi:alpha-L-rhamnosidase
VPPVVVPNVLQHVPFHSPMAVWDDVTALTPWDLHQAFDDKRILRDQYESMTVWLDTGVKRAPNGLYDPSLIQLGDWLDPKAPADDPADCRTDSHLVANAYLVHVTSTVSRISEILGEDKRAKRYKDDAARLKREFVKEYVSESGRMVSDSQTALALAIQFDLFSNEGQRQHAAERLAALVTREKFKVATGFAGK